MKVREMIEQLQTAEPDAEVHLFLDEVFVYPEQADESDEANVACYAMPVELQIGFTETPLRLNSVSLRVTEDAAQKLFDERKLDKEINSIEREEKAQRAIRDSYPAVSNHDDSAAVAVIVSRSTLDHLFDLVESCNQIHRARDGYSSHGELTISSLLAMLAEDAGMAISRPGSWEGAAMIDVLRGHGYV